MAKMLHAAQNEHSSYYETCRCRHCRTNDRRGEDSMVRRAQRARERAGWQRETRVDLRRITVTARPGLGPVAGVQAVSVSTRVSGEPPLGSGNWTLPPVFRAVAAASVPWSGPQKGRGGWLSAVGNLGTR